MKYIILVIYFFLPLNSYAGQYTIDSNSKHKIKEFTFSDKSKYTHYQTEGMWTDSIGNYGSQECLGYFKKLKTGKVEDFEVICQSTNQKGIKTWRKFERSRKNTFDAGYGISTIIDTTSPYKSLLVGTQCKYAVNRINDMGFAKSICNLDDDLIRKISN